MNWKINLIIQSLLMLICQLSWAESNQHIPFQETTVHKPSVHTKHSNMLIVARNRWDSGEGGVTNMQWCGSRYLVFAVGLADKETPQTGGFFLDIQSKKIWRHRPFDGAISVDCSQDGRWLLVYRESTGKRTYDLYRYELESGRETAVMRMFSRAEPGRREWSSDGSRLIYFDRPLGRSIKTNDPQWEIYWLNAPQTQELVWLSDSKSMLVLNNVPLGGGKTVSNLDLKQIRGQHTTPAQVARLSLNIDNISALKADSKNRVYGLRYEYLPHQIGTRQEVNIFIVRCKLINRSELKCEPAIEGNPRVSPSYAITRNGDDIFYIERTEGMPIKCLTRYSVPNRSKKTILCGDVTDLAINSDGKYLSFTVNGLFDPGSIHDKAGGLVVVRIDKH